MTTVDTGLLEHVMVDFAGHEPTEHVAPLIEELLAAPQAALEACAGVLTATVKVATDADMIHVGEGSFYGLTVIDKRPDDEVDDLHRARRIAMQALTAGINNDWPTAFDLLRGPIGSSYPEAVSTFHQCLVIWRALVNTAEGAIAVQLIGLDDEATS